MRSNGKNGDSGEGRGLRPNYEENIRKYVGASPKEGNFQKAMRTAPIRPVRLDVPVPATKSVQKVAAPSKIVPITTIKRHGIDRPLFLLFFVLLVLGLLVLYSASFYNAQDDSAAVTVFGSGYEVMLKQLFSVALGAFALILFMNFDYHKLNQKRAVMAMLILCFAALGLVLIPGIGIRLNGARRWIDLKFTTLQPSELAKFGMVLYMAYVLSAKENLSEFWKKVFPIVLVPLGMFGLILLQPNLSTGGSIVIVMVFMLFMAGLKLRHLFPMLLSAGGGAVLLTVIEEYRLKRLLSFLDPWADPGDTGWQLTQSLIAIGSGGIFGNGLGEGRQKYAFLPYPESDFIFSVIAEDFGLIGCVVVIALFCALVFCGLKVAMRASDRFGALLATGISSVIGVQTVIHIAVVSGAMPTTGLPLPFFSAGGTSIAIFMGAMGILFNISRYTRTEVKR